MDKDFEIVKTERCCFPPWKVYTTFKCLRPRIITEEVMAGKRYIIAKPGQYIRIKISKKHCPILGRLVGLDYLLPEAINQNAIAWYWDYEQD